MTEHLPTVSTQNTILLIRLTVCSHCMTLNLDTLSVDFCLHKSPVSKLVPFCECPRKFYFKVMAAERRLIPIYEHRLVFYSIESL